MKKLAFAFAAVAMAGAVTHVTTSPAFAADSVTIDTSAYNLRTAQGYAALTGRIDFASKQVCGTADVRDIQGSRQMRACRADAVDDAMAQLNSIARAPVVTVGSR